MTLSDPTTPAPAHSYVFYLGPFRFDSEIDIPELRASAGSGEREVTIRLGGVPAAVHEAVVEGKWFQLASREFLLKIPGTARYLVRNGNEVHIEIAPDAPIANISTYLLGSVFGVLCHQNGLLPLHASAVEFDGAVTAFLGDSGAGKSTMAACLLRRGHRIVSDDICLLDTAAGSEVPLVVPVAGWLKLWNESLQFLGETPIEQNRVFSTDDKFRLFLAGPPANTGPEQLRLARVVFLAKAADSQAHPALRPVPLLEAIAGLMEMTYAGYVPTLGGQKSRLFQQCAGVFRHTQALRLELPWGLDRLESVLDLLESDIFNPAGKPRP